MVEGPVLLPQGGTSLAHGGDGMFLQSGEPIHLWVDPRIRSAHSIIKTAEAEHAELSVDYEEPETFLLVLHPSSVRLFDAYCHPAWYPPLQARKYKQNVEHGIIEDEVWRRKVLLKEFWMERCVQAGRFLGEADEWAGCRVGGYVVEHAVARARLTTSPPADIAIDPAKVDPILLTSAADTSMEVDPNSGVQQQPLTGQNNTAPAAAEGDMVQADSTPAVIDPALLAKGAEQPLLASKDNQPTPSSDLQTRSTAMENGHDARMDIDQTDDLDVSDDSESEEEGEQFALASLESAQSTSNAPAQAGELSRKKRKRDVSRPLQLHTLDTSMLDTGPSSRFQSPPPLTSAVKTQPSSPESAERPADGKIFRDLAFFVDLSIKNRSDLLKDIKMIGGTIAVDYADATHVLVQKYLSNKTKWDSLVAAHATQGIWFVYVEWVKVSIREGWRLPEADHCIPGAIKAAKHHAPRPSSSTTVPGGKKGKSATGSAATELSTKRLNQIMLSEQDYMAERSLESVKQKSEYLHGKYAVYERKEWNRLYKDWKAHRGRFSRSSSVDPGSGFPPLQESPMKVKEERSRSSLSPQKGGRKSKEELDEIFAREKTEHHPSMQAFAAHLATKYGAYAPATWLIYHGQWRRGVDRFSGSSSVHSTHSIRKSPTKPSQNPGFSSSGPLSGRDPQHRTGDNHDRRLTVPAIASILHELYNGPDPPRSRKKAAIILNQKYPIYDINTWEARAVNWSGGAGIFAEHARGWDGLATEVAVDDEAREPELPSEPESYTYSMSERHEEEEEEVRGSKTKGEGMIRGPYTDEEELAMGQFAQAMREREGQVMWRMWEEFAQVYPHRKPGTWAQHYHKHQARIDQRVNDPRASDDNEDTSPAPRSQVAVKSEAASTPTPSASSSSTRLAKEKGKGKKKKVPVSSSDYHDLAHFIVDDIPEGDTPTLKDFDRFSVLHPQRDGAAWYTIWHRDKYRTTLMPLIEKFRSELRDDNSSGSGSRKPPRPHPNAYTEDEERAMAEFIVKAIPSDRPPKASDWNIFQKDHRNRSAPSWTEHYRVYKARIDAMTDELRSQPSSRQVRAARAQEVIELGSDEEEEEVEEIVPIRPPRPRRGRGSDPIVIDDDDDDD